MNDRSKQRFDESEIPAAVRKLPPVEGDRAFRERLRSDFATGRIGALRTARRGLRVKLSPSGWRRRLFGGWRALVPAGAAAALVLAVIALNRTPGLVVIGAKGTGEVLVDGRRIAIADSKALASAVRAGSEIEVPPGATVDLASGNVAMFELAEGTRMTIPRMPGRWFARAAACRLSVGELRLKTGDAFHGANLRVFTPDGFAEFTGTLVSIQCGDGGTCVCVLEGVAHVGIDENDSEPVQPGFRKVMLRDGTRKILPIEPGHREGLIEFDRGAGRRMGREG